MSKTPRKAMIIGLDCALTHLIEKHIEEGHLPTFKRLMEGGCVAENALVPYPTVTPPNWAAIATGAWTGTHGITGFSVHEPGDGLDSKHTKEAFSSERVRAEYLWDAAERAGKKSIVLNYPGSWPSKMKNGIMVGGAGLSIAEHRDGFSNLNSEVSLCYDQLVTTGAYPQAIRGVFKPAQGWQNLPQGADEIVELEAELNFPKTSARPAKTVWHVLALASEGEGLDTVYLSPTKNLEHAFCRLTPGQWSGRVDTSIAMEDGTAREVFFRVKLLELGEEGEDFKLLITNLCDKTGWSNPPEIAATIHSELGTYAHSGGLAGYIFGWYGLDTYCELAEQNAIWLADAATCLLSNHEWDLFFMHSHPPDWSYHAFMLEMDPDLNPDEKTRQAAWDAHLKVYQAQDRMLARICEQADKDTLVVLVSDHGATPDGPSFNPYAALIPAGLAVLTDPGGESGKTVGPHRKSAKYGGGLKRPQVDFSRTLAVPQRATYVYVNLKGRDPEGVVEPADYEKVQRQIIDALLTYVDPKTGQRPVALALSKQDARIMGLYGDRVGDVVYAVYPWFGSQHGQILPTAEWGIGSLKGLFTLTGPGVKRGHRLDRTVWLPDLVPTLCYLMDLPVPAQAEGAVIYQAFTDPNMKQREIDALAAHVEKLERLAADWAARHKDPTTEPAC